MKVFFILIVFSFTLVTCEEECIGNLFLPEVRDGKPWWPDTCPDESGRNHLIGSTWDGEDGYRCECRKEGSHCCRRYGDLVYHPENCKVVLNPETCQYEFYKVDAPSERC